MYRGSSFLLQKDYKIHIPVVKELLKEEYDPLAGIDCVELKREKKLNIGGPNRKNKCLFRWIL